MATSLRELIVSVSADTTKYQREMDRASRMGATYFKSVQQGGSQATQSWNAQTGAARTHATALEANTQAITRYAAVAASAFGVSRLISMADDYGQIASRIKMATDSTEEFETVQRRLVDIASRTYREYSEAANQFADTANSMRELGFAASESLDAAEALGLALVAGAADSQRGAAANRAWAQSMVQGRIDTLRFQTLLLQTPRVVQALGDALGKTTQELDQMARRGELTAKVVVPAITSQIGKLNAEVESMPTTVQDAGIRFRNELQRWAGDANEASDATQYLVRGIELLANNIDTLATVGGAAALGALTGRMVQMSRAAGVAVVGMVQSRMAAIAEAVAIRDATAVGLAKAQADVRRAQAAMGAARGTAASATATRNYANALLVERQAAMAATQAQEALTAATSRAAMAKRAALGILGGPAGLAITVGLAAAGYMAFRDNTDDATQSLIDFSGAADGAIAKFRELNRAQQAGEILRLSDELEESYRRLSETIAMMGREADFTDLYGSFAPDLDRLKGEFLAGKMTALEFTNAVSQMGDSLAETGQIEEVQRRGLIRYAEQIAETAQGIERKSGILDEFNGINSQAGQTADSTAGSIRNQAGAMEALAASADAAGKKIQGALLSLPGQIERIGKSAKEVAQLDVRDWISGEANKQGINSEDDPRFRQLVEQGQEYIRLVEQQDAAQKALAASTKAAKTARDQAARASAADEYLEKINTGYAEQVQSLDRQIALYGDVGRAAAMAYDLAHGSLSGLAEAQRQHLQGLAEWLDFMDDMAALDQVWADTAKEHGKVADRMTAYADQAARNIQGYLGDSMYNVLDGKFKDIGDSFRQMLKRMASELMASRLLQLLGTAMTGYAGAGGWGNFVRSVGGAIQADGKRAGGGRVEPYKAYDITEHGTPEVLSYGSRQVLLMGAQSGIVSPLMSAPGGGTSGPAVAPVLNVTIEKGASEDRVEGPTRNSGGGFDVRVLLKTQMQGMIADGSLDAVAGQAWGVQRRGARRG